MPANNVGRNWKRTKEDSRFGTRKLAFYSLTCDTTNNLVGTFTTGYSFRVNMVTGAITFDADITARDIGAMNLVTDSEEDDGYYEFTVPWAYSFLGAGDTTLAFVNSNGGLNFYNGNSSRGSGPSIGEPGVLIANNDGDYQYLYDETTGTSGSRQYRIKFRGNTDYNQDTTVNFVWEVVFYEDNLGYIDFLVTEQPTDWSAYNDGQGNVVWGVTDGTNWIDGLSDHFNSIAPFESTAEELWRLPNSAFHKVLQAIQQSGAELFWVGTPRNRQQPNTINWSALTFDDNSDGFVFAIADDADVPVANLDNTTSGTVVSTGAVNSYTIEFDSNVNNVYKGQRVTFSGNFGGIVAGNNYYVVDKGLYDGDSKLWITVSDSVEREVLDIVYPEGVGGEPGPVVEVSSDTWSLTAIFYNYNVEWQGTAGDTLSACCGNITTPGIVPNRIGYFISQSGALSAGYWWMERCNPTYGIFPAWQISEGGV